MDSSKSHDADGSFFTRSNARILLRGKYVLFMGDSVQRAAYKDLIALLDNGSLLSDKEKKGKCEDSFREDDLLACTEKTNGTHFTEIREWIGPKIRQGGMSSSEYSAMKAWEDSIMIRFVFLTRVYNEFVKDVFCQLSNDHFPDIICVNSTFWDISRYGDKDEDINGIMTFPEYEQNLDAFFDFVDVRARDAFQRCKIPVPCLRIWRTALPIGRNARGGLLIDDIQIGENSEVYRADMSQANYDTKKIVDKHQWDLLDAQYWFRKIQAIVDPMSYREKDGIHWNEIAHRWLSNIFLTHIADAYKIPLPKQQKKTKKHDPDFRCIIDEITDMYTATRKS